MFTNISPNMIKTYQACPKKFYYQYIEHINVPKSLLSFEKGKKIHAIANYYLKGINISRLEENLSNTEKQIWETLKSNSYFQKQCRNSEYQLSCRISKFWIGGRLDAVVYEGKDYYILDYKTGSIPKNAEFDPQTMIYLLCLDKLLKSYNSISFVYIDLKKMNNYVIKFNEKSKLHYEQLLLKICTDITTDTMYNKTEKNCNYCEYKNLCCK